ncbi:DUF222 domain-containing protein [Rhodococcus sp. NPDC127528]|uniref:HNH endonuclease signature motif containing protein n=1 Tax=unclassified Rhodococcus (in: high G+C Gram-positive bacteria) TaxID=192944 RepID=UPI0036251105
MELAEMLASPSGVEAWRLDESELLTAVPELSVRLRQLEALRVRLVHEVDQRCVAERVGASSPGVWMSGVTGMVPAAANRLVKLGRELSGFPKVAAALDGGEIDVERAWVIVRFARSVPEGAADLLGEFDIDTDRADGEGFGDSGEDAVTACANYLLLAARGEDATELARRARALHLLLEREGGGVPDAENAELNELFASPSLGGRVHVKGHFDAETGEALLTALSALSKPRPGAGAGDPGGEGGADRRGPAQRRADALADIVRGYLDSGCAPVEGGERPHVSVLVDADALAEAAAAADPDRSGDGHRPTEPAGAANTRSVQRRRGGRRGPSWMPWLGPISVSLAVRLSCDSVVTPIVIDGEGNPLDVGRSTRLISSRLRKALAARDCGCVFPGCGRPAAWTDGHHIRHWSNGGPTALSNLVLLCRFHHTVIHRGDWQVFIGEDGHPWFRPPRWVDPERIPVPAHNRRQHFTSAA